MKFNNGYWLLRDGATARYATQVFDTRSDDRSASVAVLCDRIDNREARQAARIIRAVKSGDKVILSLYDVTQGEVKPRTVSLTFTDPPVPTTEMAAYLNFDMVGRSTDNKLTVQATGTSAMWPKLLEQANVAAGFDLTLQEDPYQPTDVGTFNQASGTVTAPPHEYPSKLLLQVTVTDSGGLTDTRTVQLDPKTVDLTFVSSPSGAGVTVGESDHTAPYTETFIQKSPVTVTAAPTTGSVARAAAMAPGSTSVSNARRTRPSKRVVVTTSSSGVSSATWSRPPGSR